jgi:hypothetical protein
MYPSGNWADVADTVSQAVAYMHTSYFISRKLMAKLEELGQGEGADKIRSQLEGRELPYRGIFRFGRH